MTQLMISFPFHYWGLMMVIAVTKHTLGFLSSLDVLMYFIMFFVPKSVCLCVLCFNWLRDKLPLVDNNVEVGVHGFKNSCCKHHLCCYWILVNSPPLKYPFKSYLWLYFSKPLVWRGELPAAAQWLRSPLDPQQTEQSLKVRTDTNIIFSQSGATFSLRMFGEYGPWRTLGEFFKLSNRRPVNLWTFFFSSVPFRIWSPCLWG